MSLQQTTDHRQWARSGAFRLLVAYGLFLAAFVLWLKTGWGRPEHQVLIVGLMNVSTHVVLLAALHRLVHRMAPGSAMRRAWGLFALACVMVALGDLVLAIIENVFHATPFPSPADICFVLAFPFLLAGVLSFPRTPIAPRLQRRLQIDLAIVVLGSVLLLWQFVVRPAAAEFEGSRLMVLVGFAFPVCDLIVFFSVVWQALRRPQGLAPVTIWLLGSALLLQAFTDTVFVYLSLDNQVSSGDWPDGLWMLVRGLVLAAVLRQMSRAHVPRPALVSGQVGPIRGVFPYAVIGGTVILLLTVEAEWSAGYAFLLTGAMALIALAALRQWLILHENAMLARELRAREATLRASEARYRELFDNNVDVVFRLDLEGRITAVNRMIEVRLGYRPEEFVGQTIETAVATVRTAQVQHVFEEKLAGASATTYELEFTARDGRRVPMEVTSHLVYEDGVPVAVQGSIRDISQRRAAEAALRHQERRLSHIVEAMAECLLILDQDGVYTMANSAAERILGVSRAEIIGTPYDAPPWQRISLGDVPFPASHHPFVQARDTGLPVIDFEFVIEARAGKRTVINTCTVPLWDERGAFAGAVLTGTDVTAHKRLQNQLVQQAFTDTLTGLPNRALFVDRLAHALAAARRRDGHVAVLFLDLDGFKMVNDSLGHAKGDELLVLIADRLRGCLGPGDTLARFGGDEFTVLLQNPRDLSAAARVAERILDVLRPPVILSERSFFITGSAGLAFSTPVSGADAEAEAAQVQDLLRMADLAMYQAKAAGKDRVVLFDPAMQARVSQRIDLESGLRQALSNNEFEVYYQPIVDLTNGNLLGVEALTRWRHPERGMIPPAEFIPLAEETGMIMAMDQWVLQEAAKQVRAWREEFPSQPLFLSVNLSAVALQEPDLAAAVARDLAVAGLPAGSVQFEITESAVMADVDSAVATLNAMKRIGVRLAIDDFGTGYSSLSYLRRFPVDTVKIDRSFVQVVHEEAVTGAIVSAVTQLCHALGMSVTAEGVETEEQAASLQRAGCDRGQGYLFARPLSAADLTALMARTAGTLGPDGTALRLAS